MRKVNAQINLFVAFQILCGIVLIFLSNYGDLIVSPVFRGLDAALHLTGLPDWAVGLAEVVIVGMTIVLGFVGFVLWMAGDGVYRGMAMVAFAMMVSMLFGSVARYVHVPADPDAVFYLMTLRAVFALCVYIGLGVVMASRVLEWIARDALDNDSVKIRLTHSVPLCITIPVTCLAMGYVETKLGQVIALAIGAAALIAFTFYTNRERVAAAAAMLEESQPSAHPRIARAQGRLSDRREEDTRFKL